MSKRPITAKKIAKLRKLLRQTPYSQIDLVDYLQTRGYCNTAGAAYQMLEDGKVTYESHVVGRRQVPDWKPGAEEPEYIWVADPLVPASYRSKLHVRTS